MAGEGQMLRTARENKQWSLTDTEDVTKIRVRYIQALEEENYGILPGSTYAKGYLRTYAKHLGLNSDEIIALYSTSMMSKDSIAPPVLKTLKVPAKPRPLWVRLAFIGGVVVLMMVVFTIKNLYFTGNEIVDPPFASTPLISAPKSDAAKTPPSVPVTPPQTTPPDVIATTQDGLTAKLVFTQPCWIEIRIDGQPSFQATYAAGTTKELKGTDKIELVTIGNSRGLTITLNGIELSILEKSGEVERNVVLTKDTLNNL